MCKAFRNVVNECHEGTRDWKKSSLQEAHQQAHVLAKQGCILLWGGFIRQHTDVSQHAKAYVNVSATYHYTVILLLLDMTSIQTCYVTVAFSNSAFMA